jgi:glutathione peroxidase
MIVLLVAATGCASAPKEVPVKEFYEIEAKTITGEAAKMEQYRGKVLLIVNTASKCGFTGQYDGLQKLYENYRERGLVVLGFPSNDFMGQEPGNNDEIASFCRLNYGVDFPMFAKVSVKGSEQHPLFAFLTSKDTNPEFPGRITWNFNKFLISREGNVVARFGSRTKPEDQKIKDAIEAALNR